jgi:hypothetical protein
MFNLIKLARNEEIPNFNIADKTLLIIRNKKIIKNRSLLPMGLIASLSSIAASIIIFLSVNSYKEINDPYASFFVPVQIEMPLNILY